MKATEINTNNIHQIESGDVNGYEVFIHCTFGVWTLQIVGPAPKCDSMELDCESFNEALEVYNIEVNYLRQHAKLRPCWSDN
jgi:hypothetical protein